MSPSINDHLHCSLLTAFQDLASLQNIFQLGRDSGLEFYNENWSLPSAVKTLKLFFQNFSFFPFLSPCYTTEGCIVLRCSTLPILWYSAIYLQRGDIHTSTWERYTCSYSFNEIFRIFTLQVKTRPRMLDNRLRIQNNIWNGSRWKVIRGLCYSLLLSLSLELN